MSLRRSVLALAIAFTTSSISPAAFAVNRIKDWWAYDGMPPSPWQQSGTGATMSGNVLSISTNAYTNNTVFIQNNLSTPNFSTLQGVSVEFRVRYVSGDTNAAYRNTISFGVSQGNGWGNSLYIGNNQIFLLADNIVRGASVNLDTTGFHTYRVDVAPSTGNSASTVKVYYDGTLILTGTTFYSIDANGTSQRVYWGEGSAHAYGTAEWQYVRNTNSCNQ